MSAPTKRQLQVLRAIADHRDRVGYPPTIRELGEQLGIGSTNGVADHMRLLGKKGLLERALPAQARTLRITPAGERALKRAA